MIESIIGLVLPQLIIIGIILMVIGFILWKFVSEKIVSVMGLILLAVGFVLLIIGIVELV